MSTKRKNHAIIKPYTTVLSADPHKRGDSNVDQQKITILYCRLSNEAALDAESNSITNQRNTLLQYAADHCFIQPAIFSDYGGPNFMQRAIKTKTHHIQTEVFLCWLLMIWTLSPAH